VPSVEAGQLESSDAINVDGGGRGGGGGSWRFCLSALRFWRVGRTEKGQSVIIVSGEMLFAPLET